MRLFVTFEFSVLDVPSSLAIYAHPMLLAEITSIILWIIACNVFLGGPLQINSILHLTRLPFFREYPDINITI